MIGLGTTLRCNEPPGHIWVVLNDPCKSNGEILIVNMTTVRDGTIDAACILDNADYKLLNRPTTIAYSRAHSGKAINFERAISEKKFSIITPVSKETLTKIIEGARNSPELSEAKKRLLSE